MSKGYTVAASVVGASWLMRTLAPELCAMQLLGLEDSLQSIVKATTCRTDASLLPILGASLWSCKQAADKGNLTTSATYERLNYLNICYSVGGLLVAAALGAFPSVVGLRLVEVLPATLVSLYALKESGVHPLKAMGTIGKVFHSMLTLSSAAIFVIQVYGYDEKSCY